MKHNILSTGLDAIKSIAFSLPITKKEVAKASALAAFSQTTVTLKRLLFAGNPDLGSIE